jgi:hypothetical protein
MVDERDPHFALGVEHAQRQLVPYQWADPEHQRRYDAGYARVALHVRLHASNESVRRSVQEQLLRLQRLGMKPWS